MKQRIAFIVLILLASTAFADDVAAPIRRMAVRSFGVNRALIGQVLSSQAEISDRLVVVA